jgi:hypothetical protein
MIFRNRMLTLSSLFALLLRLSLLFLGQVEEITDSVQLDFFESNSIQSSENQFQPAYITFEGQGSLNSTIEIEERAEIESEDSDSEISIQAIPNFDAIVKNKGGSLFSNKAIRGSRLPLYDFFHSWKIHLS